jgi:hypothetical protein
MAMSVAGRNIPLGAAIAGVGGVLAIVGAPLTWATMKVGSQSNDLKGLDDGMNGGKAAILLGAIALVLVVVWILNLKVPAIAGLSTVAALEVIVGVLILLVVVAVYFTKILSVESLKDLSDMASTLGGSISLSIGAFLEVAAGVVVIVGGGLGLARKS